MKKIKQSLLSILMAFFMVFPVFAQGISVPADTNSSNKEIEVYMTVKGFDNIVISRRKVKVGLFDLTPYLEKASGSSAKKSKGWDVDKFTKPTVAHGIVKTLNDAGISYDFQDYGWSLYMAMIDENREFDHGMMSGWKFEVNGECPLVGCNGVQLNEGDDVVWYYISDEHPNGIDNTVEPKDQHKPMISTNLSNKKVDKEELKFTASANDNIDGEIVPTVKLGGTEIKSEGGKYTANLKEGKNKITITAVDKAGNKSENNYIVTFEKYNESTDIVLSVNVNNNGLINVSGKSKYHFKPVTIDVNSGNKTYYLNQRETDKNGEFNFEFIVDKNKEYTGKINIDGKTKLFSFSAKKGSGGSSGGGTISDNKEVEVYITVKGYENTIVSKKKIKVGIFDLTPYLGKATGSSAKKSKGWDVDKFTRPSNAHAIVKALKDAGVRFDLQDYGWSLYMSMINGQREFDHGATSGWKFKVNGKCPSVGCNAVSLHEGDNIVWYYISDKHPKGFDNDDDGSGVYNGGGSSSSTGTENKATIGSNDLKREVKDGREIISVGKASIDSSISKVKDMLKEKLNKEKDEKKKKELKEELSFVPVKVEEKKDNVVFKIDSEEVKAVKSNEVGIKLEFNESEIKVPYSTIKGLKDGEKLEIKKEELKDNNLSNKVSIGQKVVAKLYNFNVVKVDKSSKEQSINAKLNTVVSIKVDKKHLRGINKNTLKINWYNNTTGLWEKLDSTYLEDKGLVVGNLK